MRRVNWLSRARAHATCSLQNIQRSSAPHTELEGSKLVIGVSASDDPEADPGRDAQAMPSRATNTAGVASQLASAGEVGSAADSRSAQGDLGCSVGREDDFGAIMVESSAPSRGSRGRSCDKAKLQARVWEHLSKPPLGWSRVFSCFGHSSGYRSGRAAAKLEEITTLRRLRNQWGLQQEELNRAYPNCYFDNLEDVMWHAFKSGECENLQLSEDEIIMRDKFMAEHGALIESRKSGVRKRKAVVYEDEGSESEEEEEEEEHEEVLLQSSTQSSQLYDLPSPSNAERVFYSSLLKQNPNSQMAQDWCREHGLLAPVPVPVVSPDSQPPSLASASASARRPRWRPSAKKHAKVPSSIEMRPTSANKHAKVPKGRRSIEIDGELLKIHTGTTQRSGKGYWCLPGAFRLGSDSEFILSVSTEEDLKVFFDASAYDDQGFFLLDLRGRLDLMHEFEEVAKAIRAELPSESGEPVFNTLLHEEQIKVTRKFPELAAFLADPGRYQTTTDVMSVKHAALLDRCNALYRRVSELIHEALAIDSTDDVVVSVLETVGPEVFEQLSHRDVLFREYARDVFLSLLSIESGTQLRILPRSHRAATVDELVNTDVGEHLLDLHLPKGVCAVMHPLLVHCGSRTKSLHGNWRLHGYHGFHRDGLDSKTYKVSHSIVLEALKNSRTRAST